MSAEFFTQIRGLIAQQWMGANKRALFGDARHAKLMRARTDRTDKITLTDRLIMSPQAQNGHYLFMRDAAMDYAERHCFLPQMKHCA